MDFFGIDVPDAAGRATVEDMTRVLEIMRPKPSPAALVPVGPGRDGTYLVPDDLDGIAACFSPGVNNVKAFEDVLAEDYGIASHLCDATSEVDKFRTPLIEGMQSFEKLWLDVTGADDAVSLDTWVARHRPDPADDLMLQMDIEGAEYRNILGTSDDTLKRFRIIVLEVHRLIKITDDAVLSHVLLPFFERLDANFTCIHIHPNNVTGPSRISELDVSVPRLLEMTFLRKDRFEGRDLHAPQLPHPDDIRFNAPNHRPQFLDDYFRGRTPTAQEFFRMSEDNSEWRFRQIQQLINKQNRLLEQLLEDKA